MSKKSRVPDFIKDATNVYRTKRYIVKQSIEIKIGEVQTNVLISHDTYYLRTRDRERAYEAIFCDKKEIDGKRMRTAMYSRRYVK